MNAACFACLTCKNYVNAGDRHWYFWSLERPGVITIGQQVDASAILQTSEYWKGKQSESISESVHCQEPEWMRDVRRFFDKHQDHTIIYEEQQVYCVDLDWLDEAEDLEDAELSPRFYVERLGFTQWSQVLQYVEQQYGSRKPLWWDMSECGFEEEERRKFEDLILQRSQD